MLLDFFHFYSARLYLEQLSRKCKIKRRFEFCWHFTWLRFFRLVTFLCQYRGHSNLHYSHNIDSTWEALGMVYPALRFVSNHNGDLKRSLKIQHPDYVYGVLAKSRKPSKSRQVVSMTAMSSMNPQVCSTTVE